MRGRGEEGAGNCLAYFNLTQEDQPKCGQHCSLALGPEL